MKSLKDPCLQKIEKGTCKAAFPRFGYDSSSKSCVPFTYGGCEGNENNYETEEACKKSCAKYIEQKRKCIKFS